MALGTIPNDVRVPLVYIEIDNSQALSGNIAQDQNVMLFGQMADAGGDAGTATPLQVVEVPVSESAMAAIRLPAANTSRPATMTGLRPIRSEARPMGS